MTVQSATPPDAGYAATPTPAFFGPKTPLGVLLGAVLASVGVAFTAVTWIWGLFEFRTVTSPGGIATFFQIQYALLAAQSVFLYLGYFLILAGVLRILPRGGAWTRLAPILILVGGVMLTVVYLAECAFAPSLYPPAVFQGNTSDLWWLMNVAELAGIIGSAAVSVGTVLSLVAVARGILARRVMLNPPAPT